MTISKLDKIINELEHSYKPRRTVKLDQTDNIVKTIEDDDINCDVIQKHLTIPKYHIQYKLEATLNSKLFKDSGYM